MHNVMTYSPVPAVLQSPESLDTLLRVYQRLLATGTAHLPADHPAALWAVHGGFLSRRFLSATTTEISTTEPEALRQWLNRVWCPLHQAAVENDAAAFFCAEVNLLATELQKTDLSSPDSAGCMAWASLTGLDFLPSLPESHRPYPFRMALTVSRHLAAPGRPGATRRPLAEWRAVLFPAALTLKEAEMFPPGWLDAFICRAERVFTCARRQTGFSDARMPALPAGAFPAPQHRCASGQYQGHIPELRPDALAGETHHAPETAPAPVRTDRWCQFQSTGPAEEE